MRAPSQLLRARDLPGLIADDDGRGRVVAIRQFVKDWAVSDDDRRAQMAHVAPQRQRWWHRFGARRFDLAKIAAVVHALCDRDGLDVPAWVELHRSPRPVSLTGTRLRRTQWTAWARSVAPSACSHHNVWFLPVDLDDYRVHGFR